MQRSDWSVLLTVLLWLAPSAAAAPGSPSMRVYNQRMEALFQRLDVDGDGRLDRQEIKGSRRCNVGSGGRENGRICG